MLFIETREMPRTTDEAARTRLMDALAGAGFSPLARSMRRRMIELSLGDAAQTRSDIILELEGRLAPRGDGAGPLNPGDLFCFSDHVIYLIFRDSGLRAGLVHAEGFADAGPRLEEFCRAVAASLPSQDDAAGASHDEDINATRDEGTSDSPSNGARPLPLSIQSQASLSLFAPGAETGARAAASVALEDESARSLLRRLRDVGAGPSPASDILARVGGAAIERLIEAGLLRRDVRVSCRKTGHALLDLPAADSLALVTASRARCGLCAAQVSDEVIAETLNPTELAAALLDGATWMRDRVLGLLASFGMDAHRINLGDVTEQGESCLLAEVCGERFLFFVRDGDLTTEATRRAVALASDTAAAHLFTVASGSVEDGARMRLYEFSWRRSRDGRDLGVTILEGLSRARAEIGRALEAAARRKLARELSALDVVMGLSAAQLVLGKLNRAAARARRLNPATDHALQKWEAPPAGIPTT